MPQTMPLQERVATVQALLKPDAIRNHRVAEGLSLTQELAEDLTAKSTLVSIYGNCMSTLSQAALDASASDRSMRTIRLMLGTEPLFQAVLRGEAMSTALSQPQVSKADLVVTPNGFKIVEIEPGKVRGLGYGRLTRAQASKPVGVGTEAFASGITCDQPTGVILSESDKFHLPEMRLLGRFVTNLVIAQQHDLCITGNEVGVRSARATFRQGIMMSPFHNGLGGLPEHTLRRSIDVISDRRPDLESKGGLALLHNAGGQPEIEELLLCHFGQTNLAALRAAIPVTTHVALLNEDQRAALQAAVHAGKLSVYLKPLSNSGTRGILSPEHPDQIDLILSSYKHAKRVVVQAAADTVQHTMQSVDVLTGADHEDDMNLRVTLHTDASGQIVETSVVGSPHQHLAHGGKTSVITNLEMPRYE